MRRVDLAFPPPCTVTQLRQALLELNEWHPQPNSKEAENAQEWIDWLDKAIMVLDSSNELFAKVLHRLRALCRHSRRLPQSCVLHDRVILDSGIPICQSMMSDVYQGRIGNRLVAVKSLRVHIATLDKVEKEYMSEVTLWKSLRHINLVPFLGVSKLFRICLVSEWMPNGTVTEYVKQTLTVDRVQLMRDVANGVHYVHSLNVIHGDLKAANVLIDADGRARLVDFGISLILHQTGSVGGTGTGGPMGTLRYMSPELLDSDYEDEEGGQPTLQSDVYALGMVFWEIFSEEAPYPHARHEAAVIRWILGGVRPKRPNDALDMGLTDRIWWLIHRTWLTEPTERPTTAEILAVLSNPDQADASSAQAGCSSNGLAEPSHTMQNRIYLSTTPPPAPEIFFGRDLIVKDLVSQFQTQHKTRLAIVGMGGIGKTSVALAVLHHKFIQDRFHQRRYFVHCEAAQSAELLVSCILKVLPGLTSASIPDADPLTELHERLVQAGSSLLVLDGFETPYMAETQVGSESVAMVLRRIASIGHVSLMLTMRGTGPPVPQIAWTKSCTLKPLSIKDGKAAFLQVNPDMPEDDMVYLDIMLNKLDGLPLAVMLLAQARRAQSCKSMVQHWRSREHKTSIVANHSVPPHRLTSLDVSIQTSLSSPPMMAHKEAAQLLSVICLLPMGVFDWETTLPEVAPWLSSPSQAATTLMSVCLAFEHKGRLRVLAPIREYIMWHALPSREHLLQMRAYYFALIQRYSAEEPGDDNFPRARRLLATQAGNLISVLRESFKDSLDDDNYAAAYQLSAFLAWVAPSRDLLEDMLPKLRELDWTERHAQCAKLLAHILRRQNNYGEAKRLLAIAKMEYEAAGNLFQAAHCLWGVGSILRTEDDLLGAEAKLREAKALFENIALDAIDNTSVDIEELRTSTALCEHGLGDVLQVQGRFDEAYAILNKSRATFKAQEEELREADCVLTIGEALQRQGRPAEAEKMMENAAHIYEEIGDYPLGIASCLKSMAEVATSDHRYEEGLLMLQKAETEFVACGDRKTTAACMRSQGHILRLLGRQDEAEEKLDSATRLFADMGITGE